MEELLYEKLSENEDRLQKYGVHVAGVVNLATNLCVYPLFLLATQLQMSPRKPKVRIAGSSLSQSLSNFLFSHHPANRPYAPAQFYGYKPALLSNFLLGSSAFYRGCFTGSLQFYSSLLIQSQCAQFLSRSFSDDFWSDWKSRVLAEVAMASVCESAIHPLFVAQSRLVLQSSSRCFCLYRDLPELIKKSGIRELYMGWGGVLPKQTLLVSWQYAQARVDVSLDEYLGVKKKMNFQVMLRETLLSAAGFLLVYPIATVQRRLAVQGAELGLHPVQTRSCSRLAWKMVRTEGVFSLYRGLAAYSLAIGIWALMMPTLTQYVWAQFEEATREEMKRIIDE